MGELLYKKFLEELEEKGDLKILLMYRGVEGLLADFEEWLQDNGYVKREQGEYVKVGNNQ